MTAAAQSAPTPAQPPAGNERREARQEPPPAPAPEAPTPDTQRLTPDASSPGDGEPPLTPPSRPPLEYEADFLDNINQATGDFAAHGNVRVRYGGYTLTADRVEGNFNRELIFSGDARIQGRGVDSYADAIRFYPPTQSYRLDNPRGVLSPDLLENRVTEPVLIFGGELRGTRRGFAAAERFIATTCTNPEHRHYELRVRSAELYPGQRLVLRRVGFVLFGKRLLILPSLIIPLDRDLRRRPRTDYLPEFGRNLDEGYFARFPYTFAIGAAAAAFLRLDATERRGLGNRVEFSYIAGKQDSPYDTSSRFNSFGGPTSSGAFVSAYGYGTGNPRLPRLGAGIGPQNGGLLAIQGYLRDGFNRNFNASFRHQQGIGSNNRIALESELRRNSFLGFSNQTSQTNSLRFAHNDPARGVNAQAGLSLATNDSGGFRSTQITGSLNHSFEFDTLGANRNSVSYNFDLTRNTSSGSGLAARRNMRLDSEVRFQHVSRDYSFSAQANKTSPIGAQSDNSAFGTLERFPELLFSADTYNFRGGWLKRVPLRLDVGAGRYSEPGTETQADRLLLGLTLQDTPILRGRTEMTFGGGFEQRVYSDGGAQYILRNTTRLRQRLGGRSGFDLNYQYQQPAGGTSFLFDQFSSSHYLTAEGGYLDDSRFQLTARVGYDFLGTSRERPWQSLSTRLMWRPTPSVRLDALATYDPNTSRFFAVTNALRFRGPRDFAFDILSRYDPAQGRFSQINSQFDIPVGRSWRLAGLLRYNGFRGKLESTNLRLSYDWDCMEASLTYTENPFGFRRDRQFFLTLRIKAFPFFRSFGRGQAGEFASPGLGELF